MYRVYIQLLFASNQKPWYIPWHSEATFSHPAIQRHSPVESSPLTHSPLLPQLAPNSGVVGSELAVHLPITFTILDSLTGAIVWGNNTRLSGKIFFGQTLEVTTMEFTTRQAPWSWIARKTFEVLSLMNRDISAMFCTLTELLDEFLGNETVSILL